MPCSGISRRDIFAQNLNKRLMNIPMRSQKPFGNLISIILFFLFLLGGSEASAQGRKRAEAVRTTDEVHIDGRLDEQAWQTAAPAGEFIIYNPQNGTPSSFRT